MSIAVEIGNNRIIAALEAEARRIGFVAFGVAAADAAPLAVGRLRAWLADGCHGDMIWMADTEARRGSPKGLWPDVRSVIMLGVSYAPAEDPLRLEGERGVGRISAYAQGRDYHDVVKKRLKALARWLVAEVRSDEHTYEIQSLMRN